MPQRKYFRHGIADLEELYSKANDDVALLEELEEELGKRSTQRAKRLLERVQNSLGGTRTGASAAATRNEPPQEPKARKEPPPKIPEVKKAPEILPVGDGKPINWLAVLSNVAEKFPNTGSSPAAAPLTNSPHAIIDTWTALEALSPQTYKKPDDLIVGTGSVVYFRNGEEPWIRGERSRPKHNLYYLVYLGAIDLEQATEKLLQKYQDKRAERPSAKGLAALGVVLLNKQGIPVPETGLTLSSFGWAYARALEGDLQILKHWEKAESILKAGLEAHL